MVEKNSKEDVVEKEIKKMKKNPWMVSTILVSIVALVLLVLVFSNNGVGGVVGEKKAGDNLISLITSQGLKATISSIEKDGTMYLANVSINGQYMPVYITLDGRFAVTQPIPLTGDANANTQGSNTQTQAAKKISDLDLSNDPTMGNKSAKVTVVEFSDFSCPYCEAVSGDNTNMVAAMKKRDPTWEPIVTNLIKDYVQTGKVKFVYKYTPGHTGGHPASLVSWCLYEQSADKYWKFYSLAFAQESADTENLTKMESLVKGIGADMTKLQTCLNSNKYDSRFASDQADGEAVGVAGTPALFVNDNYVAHGAMSYADFKKAVDSALAG